MARNGRNGTRKRVRRPGRCAPIPWYDVPKPWKLSIWQVFIWIRDEQPASARNVAEAFDITIQNATNRIKKLERWGLLKKKKGFDPKTGRYSFLLGTTAYGDRFDPKKLLARARRKGT